MHPSLKSKFIPPPILDPKEVMDRNDLCWCGSGEKWKKCHRDRHLQKEIPIGKILNDLRERNDIGTCLHPDASLSNCSSKIIKAHTVQRARGLSAIAEQGHVISIKRGYENISKSNGQLVPRIVGIGDASTFMGFCSFHDNKLFEPIERNLSSLNHEAAFLLSFRAISYEYLMKINSLKAIDIQMQMDRGKDFKTQVLIQQHLHLFRYGLMKGLQNLKLWKEEYDRMFKVKNYLSMPHYAIEFDGILPFVCCGGFNPEVDFLGRRLQIFTRGEALIEHVCMNVSVIGNKSFIVFGWQEVKNGVAEEFLKSFKSIDSTNKANACLIMAVEQLENTYFKPSWWNSLNESDKVHLVQRMQSGVGLNALRSQSTYLNLKHYIQPLSVTAEIGTL